MLCIGEHHILSCREPPYSDYGVRKSDQLNHKPRESSGTQSEPTSATKEEKDSASSGSEVKHSFINAGEPPVCFTTNFVCKDPWSTRR